MGSEKKNSRAIDVSPKRKAVQRVKRHHEPAKVWPEILLRLSDGESMKTICRDDHMPCTATVYNWLGSADDTLLDKYAHAMSLRGQNFGERVTDLAELLLKSPDLDPNRARVAVDALKWAAGRLAPAKYGDRIEANVSGAVEVTLVPIMPTK